jgi:hypothetical protein
VPLQFIFHLIIFFIGVPLNLITAVVLISNKELYNARNAIWLGVIFSNFLVFLLILLEYLIFYEHSYTACRLFSVIMGKPYLILLNNLLLATCDRLIYTQWPLFHKRHVTVVRVLSIQLTSSLIVFTAFTFHYWALNVPVRCGAEPLIIKMCMSAMFIVTVLCIVLKVVVYFLATNSNAKECEGIVTREVPLIHLRTNQPPYLSPGDRRERVKSSNVTRLRVHCGRHRIRQMELNATMTLVAGLIPLCLFTLLSYLYTLGQVLCSVIYEDCETFNSMEVYFRELILLHVSSDLLVYVCHSLEFRSAARQLFRSLLISC